MYEALFQPLRIGRLLVKNRIEAAPSLPILATEDGCVTPEMLDFYRLRAAGGAGIVTVGETSVDSDRAPSHRGQLHADHDEKIPGLAALARIIRENGAVASIEINHAGRQTSPDLLAGRSPIGPSPLPSPFNLAQAGRRFGVEEMTPGQIEAVAEGFADAAHRVQRAGFEMVMLHGGHGWLLSQFLSPLANRRTDHYGGSLENRSRFALEVLGRIRERCGSELAVEYRFSADELVPGGLRPDEAVRFAQIIADHVDCLHVSCGMIAQARTSPFIHAANYLPRGRNVHLAELVKRAVGVPVTAVGGIVDAGMAADIVAEGRADMVAMCRALIADPDLPAKAAAALRAVAPARAPAAAEAAPVALPRSPATPAAGAEPAAPSTPTPVPPAGSMVRPCLRCNECLARVANWRPVRCAVNPLAGREPEAARLLPSASPGKVVVVGGGPAGMQAALVAAQREHRVVLLERRAHLGGDLFAASRPWFNDDLRRFLVYLAASLDDSAVEVRVGVAATCAGVAAESPDSVILATGAEPHLPDVLAGHAGVLWAGDVAAGLKQPSGDVVVVGGGLVGCETALDLAGRGHQVVVLHAGGRLAEDAGPINRGLLLELLRERGVRSHTRMRVCEVGVGRVTAVCRGRDVADFEAQTVVAAPEMSPRNALLGELRGLTTAGPLLVGSCRRPGFLLDAVHEGFWAGARV